MMLQPASSPGPQLRDIHLPPAPSWWPPAPGWWVLAVLLLVLSLLGIEWWRRRHRAWRQRRQVLDELERIAGQHQHDDDAAALASALHQLLRRVARQHDALAVRQRGDAWRQTLARVPVDTTTLQQLLALEQRMYRPSVPFDRAASVAAARAWLQLALKPARWKPAATEHADA
ncbi:DUF4381 family protein [Rhodanobacter denitrificans]|uniref:DUF4381 family protein n=1 Tax=Rhodanobacter denitrificans TaxID=666685 RepID=A0A368KCS3_9GAMM|nr:DUF4381 family protein [Rhodanobacter denitrificans]RCS29740.1 DUF4381 family protein [Rhodanobacter denitrificans]